MRLARVQALLGGKALRDDLCRQEPAADELLGDRGGAAAVAAATELLRHGVDRGLQVEARVLPERVVLDGGRDVKDELGDLVVLDDLAALLPEARQPRLAGPVVDRPSAARTRGRGTPGRPEAPARACAIVSPTAPPAAMTVAEATVTSVMIRTSATAMRAPGPPRDGFRFARRATATRVA